MHAFSHVRMGLISQSLVGTKSTEECSCDDTAPSAGSSPSADGNHRFFGVYGCLCTRHWEPVYSLNSIVFLFPIITVAFGVRIFYPLRHLSTLPAGLPRLTCPRSYFKYSPAPVLTWTPLRPRHSVVRRCLFP